jgi:hypothetical protein
MFEFVFFIISFEKVNIHFARDVLKGNFLAILFHILEITQPN